MVEYFFDIEYVDGNHQQFPAGAPESDLFYLSAAQQDFESGEGIVVISPEPGEKIFSDEFLLTVSYFRYSSAIDKSRTRLFLDTWEVTRYAQIFDDFLTFAPRRVPPGKHKLRLEIYDQSGRLLSRKEWDFLAHQRKGPAVVSQSFNFSGNVFGISRQEELSDGLFSNRYTRGGFRLNFDSKAVSFGTRTLFSNREDENLQPINRYTGWLQFNFWNGRYLRFNGGDTYPRLNPFLINNVFLRGFHGELFLKFLNVDLATGYTRRAIDGRQISDSTGTVTDTTNGTFRRNVTTVRTSLGARDIFQLGIMYLKGKDDPNSITFGRNPEENFGLGSDIYFAFDKNRFILSGSYNLSFYNPNIVDGRNRSREELLDLGVDVPQDIYDYATDLITVNEYLIVYPGRAYQGQARFNYLNNHLTIRYRFVQDEFHSLGQPFLYRDNKGLTITDNIRLFQNQVFLNIRYQDLQNNLQNDKPATTTNKTLAFNLSYFPLQNFPSLTVGYSNYQRSNGSSDFSDPLIFPEDNTTNTINFSSSYAFPLQQLQNRLTLNLMNYNRKDQIDGGFNNLSNTLAMILQTRYKIPLKTNLEFTVQQTESTSEMNEMVQTGSDLQLNTFGYGFEYEFKRLFRDADNLVIAFKNRFGGVTSSVTALGNESASDYNRTFFGGRITYSNPVIGRLSFNGDWVNYSGSRNFKDYILTTRYDLTF